MISKNRNLSIFIDSFDGYSDLWNTYFAIFNQYWEDCPFPIYLVSNHKEPVYRNVNVIITGDEIDWFHRTILALSKLKSKYILFTLEDYFLGKKVNNQDLFDILEYMEDNKIICYKMLDWPKSNKPYKDSRILGGYDKHMDYAINGALAIWDRVYLLELLKSYEDCHSCWDFEIYHVKNLNNVRERIPYEYICSDKRDIFGYHNGILKGKWIKKTLYYYKKEGIEIDYSKRAVMTHKETLFYNLRSNAPEFLRKRIRRKLR